MNFPFDQEIILENNFTRLRPIVETDIAHLLPLILPHNNKY